VREVLRGFLEDWILFFQSKISTFERESSSIIVTASSSREKEDEEDPPRRRRKDDEFLVLASFTAAFAAVLLPCERVGTTTTTTENGDLSTKAGKRRFVQSRRLRLRPGGQLGRPLQQRRLGDDESAKDQSLVFGHATASRKEKE
jgi:hypothetical protein